MRNIKFSFLSASFLLMLFIGSVDVNAQDFKIVTKTAEIIDDKVIITYDFTAYKQDQKFKVWIEIKNSSGSKLNIKSISGDTGKNIAGGKNKQIIWDFLDDKILIDDEIGIEVKAKLIVNEEPEIIEEELVINEKPKKTVSTGKVLLLSAVLPGMGITKVKQKKTYLILGVITYGTAAMSYVFNKGAYNNYTEYLNNETISTESDFFKKSSSQKSMSNIFMYTAAATWSANIIWTLIAASKNNNSTASLMKPSKINFTANINPYYKTPEIVFIYKF